MGCDALIPEGFICGSGCGNPKGKDPLFSGGWDGYGGPAYAGYGWNKET